MASIYDRHQCCAADWGRGWMRAEVVKCCKWLGETCVIYKHFHIPYIIPDETRSLRA